MTQSETFSDTRTALSFLPWSLQQPNISSSNVNTHATSIRRSFLRSVFVLQLPTGGRVRLLLGSTTAFYVFMVPYTKVEESFNVQITHEEVGIKTRTGLSSSSGGSAITTYNEADSTVQKEERVTSGMSFCFFSVTTTIGDMTEENLPRIRDVPVENRGDAFLNKLRRCLEIVDFKRFIEHFKAKQSLSDVRQSGVASAVILDMIEAIFERDDILKELSDYVPTLESLPEDAVCIIRKILRANIFRPFPSPTAVVSEEENELYGPGDKRPLVEGGSR
ncbi:hypothetical protein SLEP1_g46494 [Rubroshorea leprosula]|uniref:Uncharacterized protein n=1 Tax=Rubroshorea leprosula TaxID=152421 RepID=A0AAV5LP12_9ROSI|nr:hypothetical protein SLEP1_g46494 [Rubroshorea leprosula]